MNWPHICKSETFLSGKNCHCHRVMNRCIFIEQAFTKTQISVHFPSHYTTKQLAPRLGNCLVQQGPSKRGTRRGWAWCQPDPHCAGWSKVAGDSAGDTRASVWGGEKEGRKQFKNTYISKFQDCDIIIFFTLFSPQTCCKIGITISILKREK